MDNQHRKIDTYRELGLEELGMIRQIKQAEANFRLQLDKVYSFRQAQQDFLAEGNTEVDGLNAEQVIRSKEAIKQSRVNLTQASMWATTAVAVPHLPVVEI